MNGISAKRYLWIFGLLAAGLASAVAMLNWFVDPLQFYRKAAYPPEFVDQGRYQNPGLARNYPYDALVIGTSVSLGFRADRIHDTLGWKALNLAMPGASAHEQSLLLEVALRTGRVRHVLWDVNHEYLRGDPDWVSDYDGAFPAYFYDTNRWNEIPNYLLNIDTTKATLRVLLQRGGLHLYRARSLDELSRLETKGPTGRESVLQSLRRAKAVGSAFQEHPEDFAPEKLERSFDENYLRLIRAHPEVTFDLWFPPFSIARHAWLAETAPTVWDGMFRWKPSVLRAVSALPNVRLYDFQGTAEIVLNLDHYFDTLHFDETVRERVLEAVAQRSDVATPESMAAAETLLRDEVPRFRADP